MPTDTSLRIAGQHFERALQILDNLEGTREMNAENISNIAKLRAHLSAGTNNVGKFFEKKQDEAYPDEAMEVIYNANGELKVAIAYIDTIAMWHVAINDLPKKAMREPQSVFSDDVSRLCSYKKYINDMLQTEISATT